MHQVIAAEMPDDTLSRGPRYRNLLGAQLLLLGSAVLVAAFYRDFEIAPDSVNTLAGWYIVITSAWAFWSWHHATGSWFDPYSIFLAAVILFNGGLVLLDVLHIQEISLYDTVFSSDTLATTLLAVAMAITSLHLGALMGARSKARHKLDQLDPDTAAVHAAALKTVGWALFAIACVPTLWRFIQILTLVAREGYSALYQQEVTVGIQSGTQILASFFVPAAVMLLAAKPRSRAYAFFTGALIVTQFFVFMVVGARFTAVAPVLAYAWVWHKCRRPIPLLAIATAALALFVLFSVVRSVRNLSLVERSSVDVFANSDSLTSNPVFSTISEMGGTLQTVAYTIDLVPSYRPYDYGAQYLFSLSTVLPNFFWDSHPAVAHGTPSVWLINTVAPATASAGGGYGYSLIAEAFLNFGLWGVPLVLTITGFLYVRFVIWGAWSNDPAKIAAIAAFLSFFLVYARGDSTAIIRPLIWYSLFPYALVMLLRKRAFRSAKRE